MMVSYDYNGVELFQWSSDITAIYCHSVTQTSCTHQEWWCTFAVLATWEVDEGGLGVQRYPLLQGKFEISLVT